MQQVQSNFYALFGDKLIFGWVSYDFAERVTFSSNEIMSKKCHCRKPKWLKGDSAKALQWKYRFFFRLITVDRRISFECM